MNKEELKDRLMYMETKLVEQAQKDFHGFFADSRSHDDEVINADDASHMVENTDTSNTLENQLNAHRNNLRILEEVSFEPTSIIKPGAVVHVDDFYFIVAIATSKFDFEGKSFIGISPKAPIYKVLQGKTEGDKASFNGKEMKILNVY